LRARRRLTPDEEILLAKQYRAGLLASERIRRGERTRSTLASAQRGREAGQELVESHLPLVVHVARELYSRTSHAHLAFEDLISAGHMGLMEALLRFQPDRGCRFSTYAVWWIRNKMSAEIRQARWVVRIPENAYKDVLRMEKAVAKFKRSDGRKPTVLELAEAIGWRKGRVESVMFWARGDAVSLDAPVGENGEATLGQFIEHQGAALLADERSARDVAQDAALMELHRVMGEVISQLSPSERQVLILRFGLTQGGARTLAEAGKKLGVSAERVRQIEAKALRKIRHPTRSRRLKEFIE